MNVVVDDESWIHYYEPYRKIRNREGIVLPQGLPVRKRICVPYFSL